MKTAKVKYVDSDVELVIKPSGWIHLEDIQECLRQILEVFIECDGFVGDTLMAEKFWHNAKHLCSMIPLANSDELLDPEKMTMEDLCRVFITTGTEFDATTGVLVIEDGMIPPSEICLVNSINFIKLLGRPTKKKK
jgi:hypothetical protein